MDAEDFFFAEIETVLERHQIEAVKTMWRAYMDRGGLVLAHDIGLGKTLSVATLAALLLFHKAAKNILILVPEGDIFHWLGEMKNKFSSEHQPHVQAIVSQESATSRLKKYESWKMSGGVFVVAYEAYAALVSKFSVAIADLVVYDKPEFLQGAFGAIRAQVVERTICLAGEV